MLKMYKKLSFLPRHLCKMPIGCLKPMEEAKGAEIVSSYQRVHRRRLMLVVSLKRNQEFYHIWKKEVSLTYRYSITQTLSSPGFP